MTPSADFLKDSLSVTPAKDGRVAVVPTPERSAAVDDYAARVVADYDRYTAAGLDRKAAIRRIAADLRAVKHPWCSPDLVRSQLVASGRAGRSGRPRRGES